MITSLVANFEHFERGYLLPTGCKDLIDAINLYAQPKAQIYLKPVQASSKQALLYKGELFVSEPITVGKLAELLEQKPFKIIADLMQLGVFATVNQVVGFAIVCQLASRYGYVAKRTT
jgi:hypothetical protein